MLKIETGGWLNIEPEKRIHDVCYLIYQKQKNISLWNDSHIRTLGQIFTLECLAYKDIRPDFHFGMPRILDKVVLTIMKSQQEQKPH